MPASLHWIWNVMLVLFALETAIALTVILSNSSGTKAAMLVLTMVADTVRQSMGYQFAAHLKLQQWLPTHALEVVEHHSCLLAVLVCPHLHHQLIHRVQFPDRQRYPLQLATTTPLIWDSIHLLAVLQNMFWHGLLLWL